MQGQKNFSDLQLTLPISSKSCSWRNFLNKSAQKTEFIEIVVNHARSRTQQHGIEIRYGLTFK